MEEKINSLCGIKINRKLYLLILGVYIIAVAAITVFHEPWHDEAQAWQIARTASIYDILFTLPHYEGHPPLWHLILVPFAKGGLPYELSIGAVNIFFCALAVAVMLYKTNLPDLLKIFMPFTYFVFYQYGVISRPYSVMFLALMLCAVFYDSKNEKPLPYTLSILLLCCTSAYGLAIACGLCIVWIMEFFRFKTVKNIVGEMMKCKVLPALAFILIFALLLLVCIFPADNAYAVTETGSTRPDFIPGFLYAAFGLIYDATVGSIITSDSFGFSSDDVINALPTMLPVALIIWFLIYIYGRKKKRLAAFVIPYAILAAALMLVRFYGHHIGIAALLLIFWICVCSGSKEDAAVFSPGFSAHTPPLPLWE